MIFFLTGTGKKHWPRISVTIYVFTLLLLFILGVATQVDWEGFGFFPLLALTTPWSWLLLWVFERTGIADSFHLGTFLFYFVSCNVLSGAANSCILYALVDRHQKKVAEDEAWEQARRQR